MYCFDNDVDLRCTVSIPSFRDRSRRKISRVWTDLEFQLTSFQRLLPVLVDSILSSSEALNSGYFMSDIDEDILRDSEYKMDWSVC